MNPVLLILLILIAGIAIAFAATTMWVRRNPLAAFERMTRRGLARLGMSRQSIEIRGNRVVYWTGGTGRPVVLLHGVNDQAGSWVTIIARLIKGHRVLAIDLPGHGDSAPKSGPLPMRMLVDAVSAVVAHECSEPVVLVGNSMGGWVAMLYAAEHAQQVAHLVLEDASGMAWDLSHVPAFPKDREESRRLLAMVHGPETKLPDYVVDAMVRNSSSMPQKRVLDAGILDSLVDPHLSKLTMPVTLIWGEHDGLLPIAYAEALRARIPGSTLHIIPEAAHSPHRQAPAAFFKLLEPALARS